MDAGTQLMGPGSVTSDHRFLRAFSWRENGASGLNNAPTVRQQGGFGVNQIIHDEVGGSDFICFIFLELSCVSELNTRTSRPSALGVPAQLGGTLVHGWYHHVHTDDVHLRWKPI